MKLFYIDLVYPIGHKRQNEFFYKYSIKNNRY